MTATNYISAVNPVKTTGKVMVKGDTATFTYDFNGWGVPTGVTWVVSKGSATIANQALASNLATADITVSKTGKSLIKITATDGTKTRNFWLKLKAEDEALLFTYGDGYYC